MTHKLEKTLEEAMEIQVDTDRNTAARIKTERDELAAAIKPLADCEIPEGCEHLPDTDWSRYALTLGEIRRARAALSRMEK